MVTFFTVFIFLYLPAQIKTYARIIIRLEPNYRNRHNWQF